VLRPHRANMRMFLNTINPRRVPRSDAKQHRLRRLLLSVVTSPSCEHVSLALIAMNALVMTLEHHGQSQL
jgi:hypothetical protein